MTTKHTEPVFVRLDALDTSFYWVASDARHVLNLSKNGTWYAGFSLTGYAIVGKKEVLAVNGEAVLAGIKAVKHGTSTTFYVGSKERTH